MIIFDTETTGIPRPRVASLDDQPQIIEFGAVAVDEKGEIQESINLLINPGSALPAKITQITGITDEDLEDEPPFKEVYPQIRSFFEEAETNTLVAHNAKFDVNMLSIELERLACDDFPWPKFTLCTVQEFKHLFGRWPKLTDLYKRIIGEELQQTHRALEDVEALHQILLKAGWWDA